MDPHNPGAAQPGDAQLTPSEPASNVGSPAPATPAPAVESLSLTELNKLLGRKFDSKESALKSIQDTYKFATTRVADIAEKANEATSEQMKKLNDTLEAQNKEMFYLQHPEYAPHRKLIDSLGKNPAEVVTTDLFKDTYGKLSEHEKTVKLKTTLESNPRLAASRDGLSKAAELKAKQHGFVTPEVESLVTNAVIDAYGLR